MAIAPMLVNLFRGSGNAGVYRLIGGTSLVQVGNDITSSLEGPTTYYQFNRNKTLQFLGDLFTFHRTSGGTTVSCYKYDAGTGNWNSVKTLNSYASDYFSMGAYVINYGGVPNLVHFYRYNAGGGPIGVVRSADGSTFTEVNIGPNLVANLGKPIVFRDLVFTKFGSNVVAYDISVPSYTTYSSIFADGLHLSFCAFQGRLLALAAPTGATTGTHWCLYELKYGTFTKILTFTLDGIGMHTDQPARCSSWLFTDGTYVYAMIPSRYDSTPTYRNYLIKLTVSGSTFTESAVTIPSALYTSANSQARFDGIIDDETDPTTPTIHMWYLTTDNSGTRTYWYWTGSTFDGGDSSVDYKYCLSGNTEGGGERFWSSGDLNCWITSATTVATGTKIKFKCAGDSGFDDKILRCRYSTNETVPTAQCTLVANSVAGGSATQNGNDIETVDADGSTEYEFVWDTATDSIPAGTHVVLKLEIEP